MDNNSSTPVAKQINQSDPLKHTSDATPWFIHIFLAITGLLAGGFIVGFLVLLLKDSLENTAVQAIVGSVLIAISIGLFWKNKHSEGVFLDSLAFALSIAGQIFITVAILFFDNFYLFDADKVEMTIKTILLMLFQMVMLIAIPKFLHQLINSMAVLMCLVFLLSLHNAVELVASSLGLIAVIFGLQYFKLASSSQGIVDKAKHYLANIRRIATYASTIMLLIMSVFISLNDVSWVLGMISGQEAYSYHHLLAQGLLVLVSLYAVYLLLKRYRIALTSTVGLIIGSAVVILGVLSAFVSGLLATSLVIIIAFANRERILLAFGIIAQVSYIFWYYYQLDTSLLVKSISMLVVGVAMLGVRHLLKSAYFSRHLAGTSDNASIQTQTIDSTPIETSASNVASHNDKEQN